MTISTRTFDYEINGKTYEAFLAAPDAAPAPVVLVVHAWGGRSDNEDNNAKKIAALGYTAIAVDLYGKGIRGASAEENEKLMTPLVEDREMLQSLLLKNIEVAKDQPEADAAKVAAAGYCFGGLCVLDIARTGADIAGVISLHGLLGGAGNTADKITTKVLVLHGWDDPMAPPKDVEAFGAEMNKAKADWQLHAYGGTMHSFTNPAANDPDFGTVYNADAARRSFQAMSNFLEEVFA